MHPKLLAQLPFATPTYLSTCEATDTRIATPTPNSTAWPDVSNMMYMPDIEEPLSFAPVLTRSNPTCKGHKNLSPKRVKKWRRRGRA